MFNVIIDNWKITDDKYSTLEKFSTLLSKHGITHAWFGRKQCLGFTSTYIHWGYIRTHQVYHDEGQISKTQLKEGITKSENKTLQPQGCANQQWKKTNTNISTLNSEAILRDELVLPNTNELLSTLFDIPLYHTSRWSEDDFLKISYIIKYCVQCTCIIDSTNKK